MNLLRRSLAARAHHVSPFLVLGDPSLDDCVELAITAVEAGASMLELGLPYADACADGPVIQRACARALAGGTDVTSAFAALAAIARAVPSVPCNLLVYGNLVHARGVARFVDDAVTAGASSLLVPDMPFGEDELLRAECRRADLAFVTMVGPRTSAARTAAAAREADLVYVTAVQGITGGDAGAAPGLDELVARVRAATSTPVGVGFGLRTRAQLATAFTAGAHVAIVGSELVRVVEHHATDAAAIRKSHFRTAVANLMANPSSEN